jgi:hypothetical protein
MEGWRDEEGWRRHGRTGMEARRPRYGGMEVQDLTVGLIFLLSSFHPSTRDHV